MKTIIERGASWTLDETKLLLALWGQDLVQRQTTCQKRTKEVYEKIAEKFNQSGFERTADQVRTRVFNMIAEYRRILKDPSPERMKKCIFFEALHKIYAAKHMDDVKSALDDYEPEYPYSPASNTISSEKGDDSISDSEATEGNDTSATINDQSLTGKTSNNLNNGGNSNSNLTGTNNSTSNNNACANSNNNGDSINESNNGTNSNNTSEKESSSISKRIKLESPKSGQSNTNSSEQSKHSKSSHSTSSSSNAASSSANSNAASASTSANSKQHQSLLVPNQSTTAPSTPITKLTTTAGNSTPSYININSTKFPIIRTNQIIGHSNGNESININGRLPTTAIASHQLYQAPVNTFDVTSSALLIDRMFAHLSRESENMREWIALEKERLAMERARRAQETEREVRRERVLIETLMRFQEQWISFLSRLDPRIVENAPEPPPELRIPSKDNPNEEATQTNEGGPSHSNLGSNSTSSHDTSALNDNSATTSSADATSDAAKQ